MNRVAIDDYMYSCAFSDARLVQNNSRLRVAEANSACLCLQHNLTVRDRATYATAAHPMRRPVLSTRSARRALKLVAPSTIHARLYGIALARRRTCIASRMNKRVPRGGRRTRQLLPQRP